MQGQLKARRKELAEQTAFDYYLSRLLRRPVTARWAVSTVPLGCSG